MTKRTRKPKQAPDERPADLLFWWKDGACSRCDARASIGRTNSKRALGFIVTQGRKRMLFVLDKDQVTELAAYLRMISPGLLKPLGRKKHHVMPLPSRPCRP
jgi:hypothetical protein